MAGIKLFEQFEDFGNRLISLINTHLRYYKIVAYESVVNVLSVILGKLIIVMTGLLASVFSSLWLAFFIGELLGKLSLGFLAVSGLYIVVGFVIYKNHEKWIVDPLIKELGKLIEKQEDDEGIE